MSEEKKTKKKVFILEAIKKLGADVPSSQIVKWVQENHGIEITENYAYSVKKGLGSSEPPRRRGRQPSAAAQAEPSEVFSNRTLSTAHALIGMAGGVSKAIEAIRSIQEEYKLQEELVAVWNKRIADLEAKVAELPQGDIEKEEAMAAIEELQAKIKAARSSHA